MKYIIVVTLIFSLLISCNSKKNVQNEVQADSTAKAVQDNTDVDQDQSQQTNLELSADEMRDDEVFADGSTPTAWEAAGISDPKALKIFIKKLQAWVAADQRDSVAAAIEFPLKSYQDAATFLERYDQVMTEEVKAAISSQKLNQIFRNDQGAMLGNGEVWISEVSSAGPTYKIIAIN
jgi:hypothetical protein